MQTVTVTDAHFFRSKQTRKPQEGDNKAINNQAKLGAAALHENKKLPVWFTDDQKISLKELRPMQN
jgi:hypothetical protein